MTESTSGVFSSTQIASLINSNAISAPQSSPVSQHQIQPASLDLRLNSKAFRVRSSFLPGTIHKVRDKLDTLALHQIDLTYGAVLETGCVYVVPLIESLALPHHLSASANPKSSTGRIDVLSRLIVDQTSAFDYIPGGYHGPLYLEIAPRTFPVLVRYGSSLNQLRFKSGATGVSDDILRQVNLKSPLVTNDIARIKEGLQLSIDLCGNESKSNDHEQINAIDCGDPPFTIPKVVGYRARRHTALIDVDRIYSLEVESFWEPIFSNKRNELVLDPGEFYILSSKEKISIPDLYAAEMIPFDPRVGEFRVHYAGFFDPGFGGLDGAKAVLEVSSHEVPFLLEHGQTVGRLVFESLQERPSTLYGEGSGSHYQNQGLKLSKHFHLTA